MPSNPRLLGILGERAKLEVRYFELVTIVETEDGSAPIKGAAVTTKKRFMCVGLRSLAFLRESLRKERQGGTIEYAWISKVIEDKGNATDFMLMMNGAPPDVANCMVIRSESRATAIEQISICYLADAMFRTGTTPSFPKTEEDLYSEVDTFTLRPFKKYKQVLLQDYFLWIREEFDAQPGSNSGVSSGIYHVPVALLMGHSAADMQLGEGEGMTIELSLHIYPQVQLLNLAQMGRVHIRWLAMEYKQALIKKQQTFVLRNNLYLKKMNLSNDVSAWICWELALFSQDQLTVVMLLRRQYVPPLMDAVQDFALILKCPRSAMAANHTRDFQEDFIHEAELMADSLNPRAQNQSIYTHMVQSKLDALLYDEEAYSWIRSRLKLRPDGETHLEKYACIFVKGVLKILHDQNALQHPELWDEVSRRVAAACERKAEQDLDPMVVATQTLRMPSEGLKLDNPDEATDMAVSYWHSRVAVYLAWCTDGGLLGSKFTLADIISNLAADQVHHVAHLKLLEILTFLLHLRPKDLRKKWTSKTLPNQMLTMGLLGSDEPTESCIFNDRVMQVLLEMGFLKKVLPAQARGEGSMSIAYAHLLKNLMLCEASSVNLKASICRQIVAERDGEHGCALCVGLLELMRHGSLFLATYACAALVNLSQAKEEVKNFLVYRGIAGICLQQLQSKDDDLMLYTLMLLVHLTKYANHRQSMNEAGLVPQLYEILKDSYSNVKYKRRILTELCSVLGQMCNDEETRKKICDDYPGCISSILSMFKDAQELSDRKAGELPSISTKILSKVMFALKQLCANDTENENRETVGKHVCKPIVRDLAVRNNLMHQDWATNAITLLLLLAVHSNNCMAMKENNGWDKAYNVLAASPLGKMDVTRDRIQQINTRCDTIAKQIEQFSEMPPENDNDMPSPR